MRQALSIDAHLHISVVLPAAEAQVQSYVKSNSWQPPE